MFAKAQIEAYPHRLQALRRLDRDRSQLKDEALRPTGGEANSGLSDVPLHMADLGSHGFEVDLTLGLVENEERLIEEVNAALTRIDQGIFGRCEACRDEISGDRLQALPQARHCIRCARQQQKKAEAWAI